MTATRLALATPSLSQHLAVVDLREAAPDVIAQWTEFAARYASLRLKEGTGLSLFVLAQAEPPPEMRMLSWMGRIRRADASLWADIHALEDRPEPLGDLIHAISVEMMGWRLDLAERFMRVTPEDALAPFGWLGRRNEPDFPGQIDFNGHAFACPLHLLRQGDKRILRNRLWRAHLTTIFPWIEEQRQDLLSQYGNELYVPELHREKFGIHEVAELEISEIARQLRRLAILPREAQTACDAMGGIRKDLAHRKPADARNLMQALSGSW